MRDVRIGAAQFEHRNADKNYNLSVMQQLCALATDRGAEIVSFHECCIPAYTFLRSCTKTRLLELAEFIPDGSSTRKLIEMARDFKITILAGLLEKDDQGNIYNTYICVNGDGLIAKQRKLHAFINEYLTNGNEFCVFELDGVKFGILICFDNNLIENVRITTLIVKSQIIGASSSCATPHR